MDRLKLNASRNLALPAAVLFVFLIVSSAPHRVHHLFDQDSRAHCAVFTLSKACDLDSTSPVNFSGAEILVETVVLAHDIWIPYLSPSPYFGRAPPIS
jgi:hypothetical protein